MARWTGPQSFKTGHLDPFAGLASPSACDRPSYPIARFPPCGFRAVPDGGELGPAVARVVAASCPDGALARCAPHVVAHPSLSRIRGTGRDRMGLEAKAPAGTCDPRLDRT